MEPRNPYQMVEADRLHVELGQQLQWLGGTRVKNSWFWDSDGSAMEWPGYWRAGQPDNHVGEDSVCMCMYTAAFCDFYDESEFFFMCTIL